MKCIYIYNEKTLWW